MPNTAEIKESGKEKKEVGHPKDVPSEREGSWHLFLLSSFSQNPGVSTSMVVCLSAWTASSAGNPSGSLTQSSNQSLSAVAGDLVLRFLLISQIWKERDVSLAGSISV